ncbi:leucine rich repeat protein [Ichthyophthirius multifiliis]|uniref:Leucine rich repeat protein n=1 Tax=Ichthyophthirius multifiliis TaxID=5932 RepID=G0R3Q7_ICHMU|nr:leucine rich repeat protein [Ichthyophthirius multifiliis]EGR27874.1 leucine rich repeat protein [Ichthyophthirius multifiliis]|eukprot:XP_004027219.1 leucine rich repeat protein [Ichthyophthirius multifiliis]
MASIKGQIYLVEDLLKAGANQNAFDEEGNTVFHYLMSIFDKNRQVSGRICDLLLQNGANPNRQNFEGLTSLHLAPFFKCFEFFYLLE